MTNEPRDPRPALPPGHYDDLDTIVSKIKLEVDHYPLSRQTFITLRESDDSAEMVGILEEQDNAVLLELASYCENVVHSRDTEYINRMNKGASDEG